jgi:UDP-3-O-[3-hydroxymyristoyl] glucosamine N-acyltransferase
MTFTAQQIATFLNGTIEGDPSVMVGNVSKIEEGQPGTLTFLSNPKYNSFIYTTKASIVLVNNDFVPENPVNATLIRVENAYECLARLLALVSKKELKKGIENMACVDSSALIDDTAYIGSFSYISDGVSVGENTQIFPQVFLGSNVSVGKNCIIYPGVKIYNDCKIGNNCIIHSGCVIGADGFGFAPQNNGEYQKIPQIGNVVIEDDVEIGANTTVDRATMGSTLLHRGVKLDNQIQIAHNVEVGENTVMAAQVGIAGSAKIGSNCMFGGQVGIGGHLSITDNVQIGACSSVPGDITDNTTYYLGAPIIPARNFARSYSVFKKLPDLNTEVIKLRKEIEELKKAK